MSNQSYLVFGKKQKGKFRPEWAEQIDCFTWISHWYPNLNVFHVPNEIKASVQYMKKRKDMGVVSGPSDFIILTAGANHPFGVIELKNLSGTISKTQKDWLNKVISDGGFAAVAYGLDEFKKAVKTYTGEID